jgi:hypothetical protein
MRKALAYLLVTAGLLVLVATKYDPQTGLTGLIRFGEPWSAHRLDRLKDVPIATATGSGGYDGQFYAQIAIDPLLREPDLATALDAPAYRARRILVPAVASTLGLGNAGWTLQAFALLNVACWLVLARLLYLHLGDAPHGFARWVACMLALGVVDSVRQSLVDLPAVLLLVLTTLSFERKQGPVSGVWSALGNLTKETNLLGHVALLAPKVLQPANRIRNLAAVLIPAIPLGVWSVYVHLRFTDGGGANGLGNFTWPAVGLWLHLKTCVLSLMGGDFDSRYSFGVIGALSLLAQLIFLWRHRNLESPWWRIGAAYSVLLLVLSSWVWSGYWAACRAVLPMTIAFNLLLPADRRFWPWWIAGNMAVIHGVWRFL